MSTKKKPLPDLHWLYEASVQNVDTDLDIGKRIYAKHWKRKPLTIREDFCGTAKLAAQWVKRSKLHQAWGIDFDQPTLDWGRSTIPPRFQRSRKSVFTSSVVTYLK